MTVDPQLRSLATRANLELAWLRVQTSTERMYREYFRTLYRAFGIAADEHLADLRDALLAGHYAASSSTKVYFPKQSGLQRIYTLITVEDNIVYQAIANLVADRLYKRAKPL